MKLVANGNIAPAAIVPFFAINLMVPVLALTSKTQIVAVPLEIAADVNWKFIAGFIDDGNVQIVVSTAVTPLIAPLK